MDHAPPTTHDDELFVLGCVSGLCNLEPRDEDRLETFLEQLRGLQAARLENGGGRRVKGPWMRCRVPGTPCA